MPFPEQHWRQTDRQTQVRRNANTVKHSQTQSTHAPLSLSLSLSVCVCVRLARFVTQQGSATGGRTAPSRHGCGAAIISLRTHTVGLPYIWVIDRWTTGTDRHEMQSKVSHDRLHHTHRQLYLTSTPVCVVCCSLRCLWMQAHLCSCSLFVAGWMAMCRHGRHRWMDGG